MTGSERRSSSTRSRSPLRWIYVGGAVLSLAGAVVIGVHYDTALSGVAVALWVPLLLQEWGVVEPRPSRRPPRRVGRPLTKREATGSKIALTGAVVLLALGLTVLLSYIKGSAGHRVPSPGEGVAAATAVVVAAAVVAVIYLRNTRPAATDSTAPADE